MPGAAEMWHAGSAPPPQIHTRNNIRQHRSDIFPCRELYLNAKNIYIGWERRVRALNECVKEHDVPFSQVGAQRAQCVSRNKSDVLLLFALYVYPFSREQKSKKKLLVIHLNSTKH
jgi:hypothetical protein